MNGGVIGTSERTFVYFDNVTFKANKASTGAIMVAYENFEEFGSEIVFQNCFLDSNIATTDVISLTDTRIAFFNCTFVNHDVNLISGTASKINIQNITVKNIRCSTSQSGCIFFIQGNTIFNASKISIDNVTSITDGTVVFAEKSWMNMSQFQISNVWTKAHGVFIYGSNSTVYLSGSSINNFSTNAIYLVFFDFISSELSFDNSKSQENNFDYSYEFGCVYMEFPLGKAYLNKSSFSSLRGSKWGGAISIQSPEGSNLSSIGIVVASSIFSNNSAVENGGAIFIRNQAFKIDNCSFNTNKAQRGAGIYFESDGKLIFKKK